MAGALAQESGGVDVRYQNPPSNRGRKKIVAVGEHVPEENRVAILPLIGRVGDAGIRRALLLRTLQHELWHAYARRLNLEASYTEEAAAMIIGADAVVKASLHAGLPCGESERRRWLNGLAELSAAQKSTLGDIIMDTCNDADWIGGGQWASFYEINREAYALAGFSGEERFPGGNAMLLRTFGMNPSHLTTLESQDARRAAKVRCLFGLKQIIEHRDPRDNLYCSLELFAEAHEFPQGCESAASPFE